jgi:hypothetical protein
MKFLLAAKKKKKQQTNFIKTGLSSSIGLS